MSTPHIRENRNDHDTLSQESAVYPCSCLKENPVNELIRSMSKSSIVQESNSISMEHYTLHKRRPMPQLHKNHLHPLMRIVVRDASLDPVALRPLLFRR